MTLTLVPSFSMSESYRSFSVNCIYFIHILCVIFLFVRTYLADERSTSDNSMIDKGCLQSMAHIIEQPDCPDALKKMAEERELRDAPCQVHKETDSCHTTAIDHQTTSSLYSSNATAKKTEEPEGHAEGSRQRHSVIGLNTLIPKNDLRRYLMDPDGLQKLKETIMVNRRQYEESYLKNNQKQEKKACATCHKYEYEKDSSDSSDSPCDAMWYRVSYTNRLLHYKIAFYYSGIMARQNKSKKSMIVWMKGAQNEIISIMKQHCTSICTYTIPCVFTDYKTNVLDWYWIPNRKMSKCKFRMKWKHLFYKK